MTLSPIFEFADRFVAEQSELDPCLATSRGIPGHDDRLTDYSPEGHESRANHMRLALTELGKLTPSDEHDRLAKDFITERFETALLAYHERLEHLGMPSLLGRHSRAGGLSAITNCWRRWRAAAWASSTGRSKRA